VRLVRDLSRACGSYEQESGATSQEPICGREGVAGGGEAVVADLQVVVCNRV
jgi:hypothetical protein